MITLPKNIPEVIQQKAQEIIEEYGLDTSPESSLSLYLDMDPPRRHYFGKSWQLPPDSAWYFNRGIGWFHYGEGDLFYEPLHHLEGERLRVGIGLGELWAITLDQSDEEHMIISRTIYPDKEEI